MRSPLTKRLLAMAGAALALVLPLGLTAPAAAATTSFGGGAVPAAIVCVDTHTCYAVGQQSNTWGLVLTVTDGTASTPATVSSVFSLSGIACASATACYAVGQIQLGYGSFVGTVLPVTSGSAGSPVQVGGSYGLQAVACPTSTLCYAVGGSSNFSNGQGQIVPIQNGAVGAVDTVAGTEVLHAIACPSSTTCYAVGETASNGIVVPIDVATGQAGAPVAVGAASVLDGLACPTSSLCYAVGGNAVVPITVAGGSVTVGTGTAVSGVSDWYGAGCANSTTCLAVGANSTYNGAVTSLIQSGAVSAAIPVSGTGLTGAACPTSATCELVGDVFVPYTFNGVLDILSTTTTTVGASAGSVGLGQPVTLTATVAPDAPATGTPSGTVDFYDGTTKLGSATLGQGSPDVAAITVSGLSLGSHSITAVYGGDASFFTSTSAATTVTVGQVATATTLASSPSPSQLGQTVTLTATVSAGSGVPGGTVDFYDGGAQIGSAALSQATPDVATFQTSTLAVGAHTLTATYEGNGTYQASTSNVVSQTVSPAATTTVLSSAPDPSVVGQAVTFTAEVRASTPAAATPTGMVTFYDGASEIGTGSLDPSGTATLTTSTLAAGAHSITAAYGGSADFQPSTGAALTQDVHRDETTLTLTSQALSVSPCRPGVGEGKGACRPDDDHHAAAACAGGPGLTHGLFGTVSGAVYRPSGPDTSILCQPVTLTATVAVVAPGSGTPAGAVTFRDGGTPLGTVDLNASGSASLTVTGLPVGPQTITATYGGDSAFAGSTGSITQRVEYIFVGLLPPLSHSLAVDPHATVPVAFTLLDAYGHVVPGATATLTAGAEPPVAFRFRGDRYEVELHLKALGESGSAVTLTIALSDGTTHTFTLSLRRRDAAHPGSR